MRLATWNLEHLATEVGMGPKPRTLQGWTHLAGIAGEVGAQIWLLQEVDSEAAVARVLPEAEWSVIVAPCRWRDRKRAVALRTAIAVNKRGGGRQRLRWTHSRRLGPRWMGGRLCVEVGIAINGETVRILCVHLKAGCWSKDLSRILRNPDLSCPMQWTQQAAVRRWLQGDGLRIAGGDFNREMAEPTDAMRRRVERARGSVVAATEDRTGGEGRIDHWVLNAPAARSWTKVVAHVHTMAPHPENPDHTPVSIEL